MLDAVPPVARKLLLGLPVMVGSLALAGCAKAPPSSVPIWLDQTAMGGPIIDKKITSWKELKFEHLVRQRTDFSCGAAVLATLFNKAFGYETTEQQVLVNMLKIADPDVVREKGFSLLDMKNYTKSIGLEADGYRVNYDTLRKIDLPVIALINIKGYKHFVILRRLYPDHVAVGDPALGNRLMSRKEFEAAWNGVAFIVTGKGYNPANVLLDPPEPLSARRLLEMRAVLPAAETAEFGVGPGYKFGF